MRMFSWLCRRLLLHRDCHFPRFAVAISALVLAFTWLDAVFLEFVAPGMVVALEVVFTLVGEAVAGICTTWWRALRQRGEFVPARERRGVPLRLLLSARAWLGFSVLMHHRGDVASFGQLRPLRQETKSYLYEEPAPVVGQRCVRH